MTIFKGSELDAEDQSDEKTALRRSHFVRPAPRRWAPQRTHPRQRRRPSHWPRPRPAASAITTQIYSDEASFDTEKRIGVFTGHVRVFDPRFNIQSDKLTVYIHKEESQGLEKAIAEGHVGVVRDKPPTERRQADQSGRPFG